MRERIDPLIEERAPWIYRKGPHYRVIRGLLHLMLGYDKTVAIAEEIEHMSATELMDVLAEKIARNVDVSGLENIPKTGPAMVVSNHPTGIADGIILWSILRKKRPDLFYFANRDAVRIMPQLTEMIAPVEWREEKRSHGSNRETLAYATKAIKAGRLAVLFPSGRLAKRRGLKLYERPWMTSAAVLARKYKLPVVPLHITARNSFLFYLFDATHPTLRDITLFHEVLNKAEHSFRIQVGKTLDGASLSTDAKEATDTLYKATMRAGELGLANEAGRIEAAGNYSVLIPRRRNIRRKTAQHSA